MSEVLFLHPFNHARPDAIPVGSVAAVNALRHRALGRYAEEVSAQEVRDAKVILADVHWFFPLGVLGEMVESLRRINPSAAIVIGGLTASFYKRTLLDRVGVDYLVAGDVEQSLPTLIDRLLAGERPPLLPNVWTRHGPPPPRAETKRAEFDALDWLTIDWFPTYRERTVAAHARYARSRHESIADNCHPIIPLTRGCRRTCGFCYGAYQDLVFGRRARVRSPEVLLRDLQRVDADPDLRFVTLFFADAAYMKAFAIPLADAHFDLDAFLFFCGAPAREDVERVRSAFRGRVMFTIIQPTDLAPLRTDPPLMVQERRFEDLISHLQRMKRTAAAVFHVKNPPAPAVIEAQADPGGNILSLEAQDWTIVRPDKNALHGEHGLGEQLDRVTAAARGFAASNLLRALVPAIGVAANPRPLDLGTLQSLRDHPRTDPFERHVLELLVRQVLEHGLYGLDLLELSWSTGPVGPDHACWTRPECAATGTCTWAAGLSGYVWEGEARIESHEAPLCIAPLPRVSIAGEEIDLAAWSRTRLPGITVRPGPDRTVRCGGHTFDGHIDLWIEDASDRRTARLAININDHRFLSSAALRDGAVVT